MMPSAVERNKNRIVRIYKVALLYWGYIWGKWDMMEFVL